VDETTQAAREGRPMKFFVDTAETVQIA